MVILTGSISIAQYVHIKPAIQVVYKGSSATLTCLSQTVPQWRRDGNHKFDYVLVKEHDGTEETIAINNLQSGDSGSYHCYGKIKRNKVRADSEIFVGG